MIFSGCQEPFQPHLGSDKYVFAIHGYLDASADTQWVRVTHVGDSPDSLDLEIDFNNFVTDDADVWLEHLETGETAVMNDSLVLFYGFRFPLLPTDYTWVFWSTMDLQPGGTYRLTAEAPDGRTSHATVTLPEDFSTPVVGVEQVGYDGHNQVYIDGIDQLADVQTRYYMDSGETIFRPHVQDTIDTDLADYQVSINPLDDNTYITENTSEGVAGIEHSQIFVAAGGPYWPLTGQLDENIISLPKGISNIENGAGLLLGILSKTIPYKSCYEENTETLIPCETEPAY